MWKTLKKQFDSTDSLVSLALGLAVVLVVGMTLVNYIRGRSQKAATTSQTESAATGAGASLPTKYVVKEGDTLWSIAEVYYKSGYNWVDVAKANNLANADTIEVGATLTVPAVTPMPQTQMAAAATSMTAKDKSYTVAVGDDLWDIAMKEYGNGYRWVDIAKANNLTNPNLIHAGNVLQMP